MDESIIERLRFLEQRISILENEKYHKLLEKDYQKYLEKLFNGDSHLKNKFGITDITTTNSHIEIKNWSNYKNCLGQLIAYNLGNPKQFLIAAFFGNIVFKERAITLMHNNKIDVWDINIVDNQLIIDKYPYTTKDISEFIEKYIIQTNNSRDKIKVSEVLDLYISYNNQYFTPKERGLLKGKFCKHLGEIKNAKTNSRSNWTGWTLKK